MNHEQETELIKAVTRIEMDVSHIKETVAKIPTETQGVVQTHIVTCEVKQELETYKSEIAGAIKVLKFEKWLIAVGAGVIGWFSHK